MVSNAADMSSDTKDTTEPWSISDNISSIILMRAVSVERSGRLTAEDRNWET